MYSKPSPMSRHTSKLSHTKHPDGQTFHAKLEEELPKSCDRYRRHQSVKLPKIARSQNQKPKSPINYLKKSKPISMSTKKLNLKTSTKALKLSQQHLGATPNTTKGLDYKFDPDNEATQGHTSNIMSPSYSKSLNKSRQKFIKI